jgi:hypothetical protein
METSSFLTLFIYTMDAFEKGRLEAIEKDKLAYEEYTKTDGYKLIRAAIKQIRDRRTVEPTRFEDDGYEELIIKLCLTERIPKLCFKHLKYAEEPDLTTSGEFEEDDSDQECYTLVSDLGTCNRCRETLFLTAATGIVLSEYGTLQIFNINYVPNDQEDEDEEMDDDGILDRQFAPVVPTYLTYAKTKFRCKPICEACVRDLQRLSEMEWFCFPSLQKYIPVKDIENIVWEYAKRRMSEYCPYCEAGYP